MKDHDTESSALNLINAWKNQKYHNKSQKYAILQLLITDMTKGLLQDKQGWINSIITYRNTPIKCTVVEL